MTEMEWLGSDDPRAVLEGVLFGCVSDPPSLADHPPLGRRKLLLVALECWRRWSRAGACHPDALARCYAQADLPQVIDRGPFPHGMDDLSAEPVSRFILGYLPPAAGRHPAPAGELADLIRCVVGNPFRPVHLQVDRTTRAWRFAVTGAEIIYHERVWEDMPVLADALEEAGCTDERVLMHLRGWRQFGDPDRPGWVNHGNMMHARGCHVVDMILGKE